MSYFKNQSEANKKAIITAHVTAAAAGTFQPRPTSGPQPTCNVQELADVVKAPLEDVNAVVDVLVGEGTVRVVPGTSWNTKRVELVS